MELEQLLSYQHLIVAVVISGAITAAKVTLDKLSVLNKTVVQAILPWAPMLLGVVAAFVPGVILADSVGFRVFVGLTLGAISGQVWKIFRTKLDMLKGKI